MYCMRCEGMMVQDELIDLQESSHPMRIQAWRCVSCGNLVDPLIMRHRMVQQTGALRFLAPGGLAPALVGGSKAIA